MLKRLFLSVFLLSNISSLGIAQDLQDQLADDNVIVTESYTEYHALKDKDIFIRKMEDDYFKITLYDEQHRLNKQYRYYLDMDVQYNKLHKKIKYIIDKRAVPSVTIDNAQITDLFCNKKYLVITLIEYSFAYQMSAENNYYDIYIDLDPNNSEITVFDYNLYPFDTRGPIDLQIIEGTTEQKCHKNSIEFIYDTNG